MSDDDEMMGGLVRAGRVKLSGAMLSVVAAGPVDGRLVVLLHGFPEFWWGWRKQIEPLASAGFRVLAPDMRGYGRSDAPQAVANYRLEVLVEDVAALVESEGRKSCVFVGHDWGGIGAWAVAARRPERVERLVVLNAPHLDVAPSVMLRHPTQLLRSSYIAFFQLPILAEAALAAGDYALMKRLLLISSRRGVFGEEDLARYAAEWARRSSCGASATLRFASSWRRRASTNARTERSNASIGARTGFIWRSPSALRIESRVLRVALELRFIRGEDDPANAAPGSTLTTAKIRTEHLVEFKPEMCTLDLNTVWFGGGAVVNAQTTHLSRRQPGA